MKPNGFSLIELLIVLSIISILSFIALPVYTNYIDKAKFTEIVQASAQYKLAAEIAWQTKVNQLDELDSGKNGIPASYNGGFEDNIKSISMRNGVITIIAKNIFDDNNFPLTYVLKAQVVNKQLKWSISDESTCLTNNVC